MSVLAAHPVFSDSSQSGGGGYLITFRLRFKFRLPTRPLLMGVWERLYSFSGVLVYSWESLSKSLSYSTAPFLSFN